MQKHLNLEPKPLHDYLDNIIQDLKEGAKRVDMDAYDLDGSTPITVSGYWVGAQMRIDIKWKK